MNSNRLVLRPTENRLPLKDVSSQKYSALETTNKSKFSTNTIFHQQENLPATVSTKQIPTASRPILTAIRSLRQQSKENDQSIAMLISPMVKASCDVEQKFERADQPKTREQLEQDLYELLDYRQSIFEHLKSIEQIYAPKMNFMENQSDINSPMRTILVDWLIEVSDEYKLNDETLFLSIQYIDRFLSTVNVTRAKLQLLGTTCMYIAAKYEEMYPPALEEFSFITDNTYESKHILRMEQIIMKMLNFSLSGPTCFVFLQYYLTHLKSIDDYESVAMLSKYFCTLTLLHDHPFSSYRSSLIAASCLLLAIRLLNQEIELDVPWSSAYIQLTTYTQDDLRECTLVLAEIHSKSHQQEMITSSLLRRYLNTKKGNESYQKRVRQIIHHSKGFDIDEDDSILNITFDENNMSMDFPC